MMKRFGISAFWQFVLVLIIAYLVFDNAFPPLLPLSLMIQYMVIVIAAGLLYFSFDDERWNEFMSPLLAVLRNDNTVIIRWGLLIAIPATVGYTAYLMVKPSFDAPVELRQVHPAPPSKLKVFNKTYDLTTLENPVREEVLKLMAEDEEAGWDTYSEAVREGRDTYYQNCFYCHGDLLDGQGHFADGFNPLPANFQDVGTIAQLQEAFLFWRITTGGPGLPKEGTPWNSAMPVWHEMLDEQEVWNTITFLYDYVGQVPRIWDPEVSKVVTGMKDKLVAERKSIQGKELYQFRCEVCHGEEGMGDGPAADFLYPRPRDFSLGLYKYKTSEGSVPPRDDDLIRTIKHGLPGTGMPGWKSLMSDKQIASLVPVIKGFDTTAAFAPEDADDEAFDDEGRYLKEDFISFDSPEPTSSQVAFTPESIARGKEVFEACAECHGDEGRGNITSGKKLEDDWGYRIWPRDLSKPWTWRWTNAVADTPEQSRDETIKRIYTRLSIGLPGTPMPAHRAVEEGNKDPISLDDRWHVANYVYSLRENESKPGRSGVIQGVKVDGALPESIDDAAWENAPATALRLVPNIIKEDRLFSPLNDSVSVRTLFNEDEIVFLLEVNDRTDSRPGEEVSEGIQDEEIEMQSDAFAIQLPKQGSFASSPVVEKPLYRHGDASHPTTIWYWNAGAVEPERKAMTMLMDAIGPDQKIAPRQGDESLMAQGQWKDGKWRVIMKRPRQGSEESEDLSFSEGQFLPISFANWDGSNGEVGSKHTLTSWYWLLLPPKFDATRIYGIPAGVALLVFLAGLLLVRSQRNKSAA
ncbi:MAG: c-type cytochrome [Motiliproteus sp.]|nr:c-type cytochrome [Motiliproteus sp.]MCW9051856.1 c-type cytochrome [Motiliproteus sp.]